jgi:hypothetical protein
MKEGFPTRSSAPSASDASTKIPTMKSTVNSDTTRSKAAATPKTLGPRVA